MYKILEKGLRKGCSSFLVNDDMSLDQVYIIYCILPNKKQGYHVINFNHVINNII